MNNFSAKRRLLFLFSCLVPYFIFAGNVPYRFVHIETRDGLPSNFVFSVAQDKKGFIWIATNNGLARYDGYNFRVFQPQPTKKDGIKKKLVNKLYLDLKGNLWIWSQGMGVSKMNTETEQFTYYSQDLHNTCKISGNIFKKFFEDKDSGLWIASNKGLSLYNAKKDLFVQVYPTANCENRFLGNNILDIREDAYGSIWFLSTKGIGCINRRTFEVKSLGTLASNSLVDTFSILDMIIDNIGNLWFGTESNGVFCYNIASKKLTNYLKQIKSVRKIYKDAQGNLYGYSSNPINTLFYAKKINIDKGLFKFSQLTNDLNTLKDFQFTEDKSGNIWISSDKGLVMFDPAKGLTYYHHNIFDPSSIAGDNVQSVFVDNSENLWVSVNRNGISKADLKQKPFRWYISDPTAKGKCLAGNYVTSVYEDHHHNMWVGCYGVGLTRYNPSDDSYKTIFIGKDDPAKLNTNAPYSICEDTNGFLWLGIENGQLDKIDLRTSKISHYSSQLPVGDPYYFKGTSVRKILPDKLGNLWLACDSGIVEYEQKTEKFIYHSILYEKDLTTSFFYRTLYIDEDGIVWGGSNSGGLIKYNKSSRQFSRFLNNPKKVNSISSNTVYSIYEDKNGYLWVGTSNGLNKFDRKTEIFSRIQIDDKLNNASIYSIIPDNTGNFWMSTDFGIVKLNSSTLTYVYFDERDGLLSNEFISTSQCVSTKGEIFLGSSKGLISFFPSSINKNRYNVQPVITNLRIFNKSIGPGDSINRRVLLQKQIWATKKITLNYNENDFTLEFSALHFSSPGKVNYLYKLDGFNENWMNADATHRWANYTGLPPGNYIFRLQATNCDGVLCSPSNDIAFEITIEPPFWKTLWFRIVVIVLIVSLLFFYLRIRFVRLKKMNTLLERMVSERTSDLEEVNAVLEESREEISLQKEELESQYETLEETNNTLIMQKEQIEAQNRELDQHRFNLQLLVNERTKELEKALYKAEESERLKSSFLANMSHEIRTPMNAIIGFSIMLRQKDLPEDEKDEFIKIIMSNSESLLVLINDIMDLSKIQASQMVLYPTSIPLITLLNELKDVYTVEAEKKNLSIKFAKHAISNEYTLYTDKVRLKQVIGNLITNAIKFTSEGEIEFGLNILPDIITFYVKDTGVGISPEVGDAIFERFLKLENTEKLFGGTGLGLAICKSLVEQWGGTIWYESELNAGTTFYFTHPVSNTSETI